MPEIYLDNNATTHLADSVRDALRAAIEQDFGNPSSAHRSGEKARRAIVGARDAVAALLGVSADHLLFGSGATELNYWVLTHVLRQGERAHLITTEVEHSCVLETAASLEAAGIRVTRLPVGPDGRINIEQLLRAIDNGTSLVSIQWVNNETGVIQPVHEIGEICTALGVPFHCDAAQAIGKIKIDFTESGIDFLTVSAHKMSLLVKMSVRRLGDNMAAAYDQEFTAYVSKIQHSARTFPTPTRFHSQHVNGSLRCESGCVLSLCV